MADDRKAVEGAIDYAVVNATTEPVTRAGAAGYIQGVATDYYAGRLQRTGSRLGARGWLIEKILDGGPPTTNMAAWFKYGTGITVTGLGVSQWDDQSGNGRHLLQAVDTNRPALQSDNSILFDGVDNFMACNPFTLPQPVTVYALFKEIAINVSGTVYYDGNGASNRMALGNSGTLPRYLFAGAQAANNSNLAVGFYGAFAAVFNGASSSLQVNQTTETTGNPGTQAPNGFYLAKYSAGAFYANIEVKEIIIYSSAHDATTRAQVIRYLQAVGGI
jgi:hypothetical protein